MRALLRFFYLNHYKVIIEGVETPEHKKWLDEMPYYALQESCGRNPASRI